MLKSKGPSLDQSADLTFRHKLEDIIILSDIEDLLVTHRSIFSNKPLRPYFVLYLVYGFFLKILRSEEGKK